jgi:AraC-like DNA-binding protein
VGRRRGSRQLGWRLLSQRLRSTNEGRSCGAGLRRSGTLDAVYDERHSPSTGGVAWARVVAHQGAPAHRVVPDGCIDVICTDGTLVVAGPDTTSHLVSARAGSTHLGIRFRPGTAPFVLGVPAHELLDRRVPLEQIWPERLVRQLAAALADDLGGGAHLAALITLERAMAASMRRRPGPERWVAHAVSHLDQGTPVREVARQLGYSERQFERRSHDLFGYGPKLLTRIRRLDRASTLALAGVPLASVAAEAGYADQAHLAREARSLVGVPMTAFLRERRASS